ncbi:MAG: AMP-binding protein, partial [Candidatus Dormiibacterota bacterium]
MLDDRVTPPYRRQLYESTGLWDATTLADRVRDHARANGDGIAVVDQDRARSVTYDRLDGDATRVAKLLAEIGVEPGDVVAVQLPNWYETVAIAVGILRLGAVINLMLPIYRSKELRHMLNVGKAKVLFTPATYHSFDHIAMVTNLRSDVPSLLRHIAVDASCDDAAEFHSTLAGFDSMSSGAPVAAKSVSELIFTSGTEAEPKAVMHTEQTT